MKLEVGYNHPFEIRRETCRATCNDNFTVLYLSDLHLNRYSGAMVQRISKTIVDLQPTIVLLGGDYADSEQGLHLFTTLLQSLAMRQHVYAIAGNHDYRRGIDRIRKIVTDHNIGWIENGSHFLQIGNTRIRLDGNCFHAEPGDCDFSMLVLHQPVHTKTFKSAYDLAFAGHLHGSQFIFWQNENGLYPGRIFYRWNRLKSELTNGHYFISKGLGDTLPLRYNCRRDMIFVSIEKTQMKEV